MPVVTMANVNPRARFSIFWRAVWSERLLAAADALSLPPGLVRGRDLAWRALRRVQQLDLLLDQPPAPPARAPPGGSREPSNLDRADRATPTDSDLLRPRLRRASPGAAARSDRRRASQRRPLSRGRLGAPGGLSRAGRPAPRGSIAQHDERFVPHVLAVVQGATVDFPNEDDVFHNVFSLSSAAGTAASTSGAIRRDRRAR